MSPEPLCTLMAVWRCCDAERGGRESVCQADKLWYSGDELGGVTQRRPSAWS